MIEIEHHDGERTVIPASRVEFAIQELFHVAAVVEAGKRVADRLHTERFTEIKVGNRESDVFGDCSSKMTTASRGIGVGVGV
jgi:hypothetical protein